MMSHKQLMPLLVLLGVLPTVGFAQSPNPPLNFGNNFFVTGDYIVAGAYGMTQKFTTINGITYAVGTIAVPDSNPGITGTNQVPKGAQIVAALLYWQTVEKVGVTPGAPGSGQNGYFRPLLYSISGGPATPGYAISGTNVGGSNTVSWSSGGCSGSSTGKLLRTYRADVAGGLPLDASGNPIVNTVFEVRLPSSGNSTPLSLGATLVVIYRIPSGAGGPNIPLKSIVIYDGDYAQGNAQLTMTQTLQGFYDAAHSPVSRLTHIVGGGQSNKFQTVYLSSGTNPLVALPSLYSKLLPAFPGWYGNWDNPTWTFTNASTNPIKEDNGVATTQVKPFASNQGCVSWGAVIVSTTVKNSDNDGILDSWKTDQGYCDVSMNPSCTHSSVDPAWVDLSGAAHGQKDIFLQYDYLCSHVTGPNSCAVAPNGDYSFDPRLAVDPADGKTAVQKVVDAFGTHTGSPEPFVLHAIPGNAIAEGQANVTCTDSSPNLTCPFPNVPGTVGFREGLAYIKNLLINPTTGAICDPLDLGGCSGTQPVFQHGKKDSYHYALFSHAVGLPSWFLSDPTSLTSVKQSGRAVTFTTPVPHGISHIMGDSCANGRVTVIYAITNPNLNGTYCVASVTTVTPYTFTINLPLSAPSTTFTYTFKTDPNLAVANGQVTSMSGFSDVGGQNSVVSLGFGGWGPPNVSTSDGAKWQTKAGTFMHELGHTLGLTHGGTFYNNLGKGDYTPSYEVNCKPNVQTSMSYLFQVDLLAPISPGQSPKVDYSEEMLPTLSESSPQGPKFLSNTAYAKTSWYQLTSFSGGTKVGAHCDGTPLLPTDPPVGMAYVTDSVSNFFWSSTNPPGITGNDINFNGKSTDVMHGHDEWDGTPAQGGLGPSPGVDLQQVSATGTITAVGPGGEGALHPAGGGGVLHPAGGGGALHPAGGGGALHPAGGGGALHPAGGGGLGIEITHEVANSYARPPSGLTIVQEEASPRKIDLSWFAPTFGQIVQYNIYQSAAGVNNGAFTQIASGGGTLTTYKATVNCNQGGYQYRVTAVVNTETTGQQESVPSNVVPAAGQPLLTGCYTVPSFAPAVASAVHAESVNIAWTLQDDFYVTPPNAWADAQQNVGVTNANLAANTLYAVGPVSNDQCAHVTQGRTLLVNKGVKQNANDALGSNGDVFTFTWNNTDNFCAGSYTFELDLDSGQKFTSSPLQLNIDINDTNSSPHITTVALPAGIVGKPYSDTLTEDGGTAPFTWIVTGPPTGISQQPAGSATISGSACLAGSYGVNATVMDSASPKNSGSQGFTLQVNQANTTTSVSSNANPSVFQQAVTFTVTVAPQYSCTPRGTVTLSVDGTQIGSNSLTNGTATFPLSNLSVGMHSITASYGGDANFNASNSNSTPWSQTVNKASTQLSFNSVMPSTVFIGQPITISYTFSVQAPGAGSPIPPSGNITVTAMDSSNNMSSCMAAAVLGAGACTLSPAPTQAGPVTFTINYPGDGNFVLSGANGGYTVYQLVFTTQPSNTGVGLTITPAVVVTAEDSGNNTLTTFTGGITLAIGSGPGTLSGTTTQNAVTGVATFSDLSINKIANAYTLEALPSGGVPDATSNAFNIDTFYVDNQGNFGTLDLLTGTATQIASATVPGNTGIDLTPGLQIYTYNTSNQLLQLDPLTGTPTSLGRPGSVSLAATGALTDGSYFGIDATTGILYSINLTSGAITPVGQPTSTTLITAGCSFEASLTGSASVLYYTIGSTGGGDTCTPFTDTLYQINPADGTATAASVQVTISPVNAVVGSAFVGGTLYGFTADGKEYAINPATGVATLLNSTTATAPIIAAGSSQ